MPFQCYHRNIPISDFLGLIVLSVFRIFIQGLPVIPQSDVRLVFVLAILQKLAGFHLVSWVYLPKGYFPRIWMTQNGKMSTTIPGSSL
jgi:hypothetical protein